MDTIDREELIRLLAQALMRDAAFRPLDADRRQLAARICAAGLIDHLYRCGIRWSRVSPAPPHKTPG